MNGAGRTPECNQGIYITTTNPNFFTIRRPVVVNFHLKETFLFRLSACQYQFLKNKRLFSCPENKELLISHELLETKGTKTSQNLAVLLLGTTSFRE